MLAVTIGNKSIADVCGMSITDVLAFIDGLVLSESEKIIASRIYKELKARLHFLVNVGLEYLTLSRSASGLSGGEATAHSACNSNRFGPCRRSLYFR